MYNFGDKARIPIRPLSIENKDLALPREIVIDYTSGTIYVKLDNGDIINSAVSSETIDEVIKYIKENSEVVTNAIVINDKGEEVTIQEAFTNVYSTLNDVSELDSTLTVEGKAADAKAVGDAINTHGHKYAGSDTDGGAANKVSNALNIKTNDGTETFDGSDAKDIDLTRYFEKTGGKIDGDVTFGKKIILTSDSYGETLPETGVEGQVFFKIMTDE